MTRSRLTGLQAVQGTFEGQVRSLRAQMAPHEYAVTVDLLWRRLREERELLLRSPLYRRWIEEASE